MDGTTEPRSSQLMVSRIASPCTVGPKTTYWKKGPKDRSALQGLRLGPPCRFTQKKSGLLCFLPRVHSWDVQIDGWANTLKFQRWYLLKWVDVSETCVNLVNLLFQMIVWLAPLPRKSDHKRHPLLCKPSFFLQLLAITGKGGEPKYRNLVVSMMVCPPPHWLKGFHFCNQHSLRPSPLPSFCPGQHQENL